MALHYLPEIFYIITIPLVGLVAFSEATHSFLGDFCASGLLSYIVAAWPSTISWLYGVLIPLCYRKWRLRKVGALSPTNLPLHIHRALMMIPVTLCIFMCDFCFWVPHLGKTDSCRTAGRIGLMDVGVGGFVFNGGLFASKLTSWRRFKTIGYLLILGFVRLFAVKTFGLHVNPHEYGLHLNFYFVLAFVHFLYLCLNSRFNTRLALALLALHEVAVAFLAPTLFSDDRSNLIMQNKEGLFSIVPYFACYLLAAHVGQTIASPLPIHDRLLYCISCLKVIYPAYVLASWLFPISKPLCNLTYTAFNLLLGIYGVTICFFVCKYYASLLGSLPLIHFVSRNMMFVFLFANLLVLLFKLVADAAQFAEPASHAINMVYAMLVCVVAPKAVQVWNTKDIFNKFIKSYFL